MNKNCIHFNFKTLLSDKLYKWNIPLWKLKIHTPTQYIYDYKNGRGGLRRLIEGGGRRLIGSKGGEKTIERECRGGTSRLKGRVDRGEVRRRLKGRVERGGLIPAIHQPK